MEKNQETKDVKDIKSLRSVAKNEADLSAPKSVCVCDSCGDY